jgi:hypothetical protein
MATYAKTLETPGAARTVRADFGLDLPTFARMTGVPISALEEWEENGFLDGAAIDRVDHVVRILHGLARVMQKSFIPTWLAQPNAACKEIGIASPLDLLERGDYAAVEDMLYYLESGTPG